MLLWNWLLGLAEIGESVAIAAAVSGRLALFHVRAISEVATEARE